MLDRAFLGKLSAVSEVLFIILLANIASDALLADLAPSELQDVYFDPERNNAWTAAAAAAIDITPKLLLMLLLSLLAWMLVHRKSRAQMKLTRNGYSLLSLGAIGLLTFAFAALPWKTVVLLNQLFPFGEGLHAWDAVNAGRFSSGLVALVLASAMLIPPLLEEMTVRGYQLSRLQMHFTPVPSILVIGILFPLLHGHFYAADAVVLLLLASFIFSSVIYCYVAFRSGSVIPAIIAHSLSNSPEPSNSMLMGCIVLAMLFVAAWHHRLIWLEFAHFLRLHRETPQQTRDVLWVFPVLLLILSPALIDTSLLLLSLLVFLILAILGRR